jgi:iron complex transport system substrate-binding protein
MAMSPYPRRIVSLAPSNTEILCALDLGPRLVGVDDDSDHPAAVRALPRVGRDLQIDADRVAALAPDLVLASLSVPGMERNIAALRERGLPFLTLAPERLVDVLADIRLVGETCGAGRAAAALLADLERRVAAVRAATAALPPAARPGVHWEWWPRPAVVPGRRSWITDLLALAGARNLYGTADRTSLVVEDAAVRAADPAVAVVCWCGARRLVAPEKIAARPGWAGVRAVREGRLYVLLEASFGRPGPRLIDGLELLCGLLHPGLLPAGDAALARRRAEVRALLDDRRAWSMGSRA